MKYLIAVFAIVTLVACNLTTATPSNPPAEQPTTTVVPSQPIAISETLSLSPIARTTDDGRLVLTSLSTVTVSWDNLPDGVSATFVLGNYFVDGGISEIGQGQSASFVVPEQIEGEVYAYATVNGTQIESMRLPILTENVVSGSCQYYPPQLGSGVSLYTAPDMNSTTSGTVIYNADYEVLASQNGTDDNGGTRLFYQIQQVDTDNSGWVPSNVGEQLLGDCSAIQ